MYIAFDDTDSTNWMCTTYLAVKIIEGLRHHDLLGPPRLVRLNPAVPWKTRGNGAVCLKIGKGYGKKIRVGKIRDREIYCYMDGKPATPSGPLISDVKELIQQWARIEEGANPGLVVSERKPPQWLYWKAVREIVSPELVREVLQEIDAMTWGAGDSRGIVGAAAAMAWRPRDRTYELLAYRKPERWGTKRELDERSVIEMDKRFPATFNNYDYQEGKPVVAPNSPCPVLFGIRGDRLEDLEVAMRTLRSEEPDSWLIFLTNQATDDHVIWRWKELKANSTYAVRGKVIRPPVRIKGGHVVIGVLTDGGEHIDATAYEPSKSFRDVVGSLEEGDRILLIGELREEPRTLNIEKLKVIEAVEKKKKVANPICPRCGKRMKSKGSGKGYRCRRCGYHGDEDLSVKKVIERSITTGWYEPPVSARRHLSKPLKRMGVTSPIVEN